MKVPEDVVRRAANVYDQCMCEPPLGVAGKDLSFAAMQVAIDQVVEDIRGAVRIMVAQPDVPALGEAVSLNEAERLLFRTVPGRLLREGVPFMCVPFADPSAVKVAEIVREAHGGRWTPESESWLQRMLAMAAKNREPVH